ncbi:MAG: ScpA family protein [Bdellovibrionota bacterium]|nr:ScpA family protein [Bdellovibrionota bacterium]
MLDTSIKVQTDEFDGPLGLLLLLIQKEEMSIRNLNLTKITKQYLSFIDEMRELNFDVAGEYLFLASNLIFLKSKSALREDEGLNTFEEEGISENLEIKTKAELVRRLEQLKHYQEMGEVLWALPKRGHETFVRPKIPRAKIVNSLLVPMDLEKLTDVMLDFLRKEKRKFSILKKETLSIKKKLLSLKKILVKGGSFLLTDLISEDEKTSNLNIVITFISLLELARLKKVKLFQNESLGQIYIEVIESLENFDVESATGFENEEENNEDEASGQDMQKHEESNDLEERSHLEEKDKSNKQLLN